MKAPLKALDLTVILVLYTAVYLKLRRFGGLVLFTFGDFRTLFSKRRFKDHALSSKPK